MTSLIVVTVAVVTCATVWRGARRKILDMSSAHCADVSRMRSKIATLKKTLSAEKEYSNDVTIENRAMARDSRTLFRLRDALDIGTGKVPSALVEVQSLLSGFVSVWDDREDSLSVYFGIYGAEHVDGCSEDSTCECPVLRRMCETSSDGIRYISDVKHRLQFLRRAFESLNRLMDSE